MKTISRKQAKDTIKAKGLEASLRIGKTGLTAKQKKFAEGIVLEGLTASDAYRKAYDTSGRPAIVNPEASRLTKSPKIAATMQALEHAKELAASQTAEALKSLVVSTLVDVATNSNKDSVRVQAVKALGTVVGVDMFRETKRIESVRDSSDIREQILGQLKTMMLDTSDAETVDASDLLSELINDNAKTRVNPSKSADDYNSDNAEGTVVAPPENANEPHLSTLHTIPHEQSPQKLNSPIPSKHPPSSLQNDNGGGDIFLENDELSK